MFSKKTFSDIDLKDKTVIVRVDYNVPLDEDGIIVDDYRIEKSLPTIKALIEQHCKIILMSHLGRPNGHVKKGLSLRPVAEKLSQLLDQEVYFIADCIGVKAEAAAKKLESGQLLMLENLRFHPEEEANDQEFAKKLASLGEIFVQDGFGVVHRAHASTEAITKYLPSIAGILVETEVNSLTRAMRHPKKPFVAIIGGAKIKTKIELLDELIERAQRLVIGGAMANTFLKAKGLDIGKSLFDESEISTAQKIITECQERGIELILPLHDVAVAKSIDKEQARRIVESDKVADDDYILDIGEKSIESILENLKDAKTVVWNGPLGMTELEQFQVGTAVVAKGLSELSAETVIGGGDTTEFVRELGLIDKFDLVSTGGGASLELMAGKTLPGVEALLDK